MDRDRIGLRAPRSCRIVPAMALKGKTLTGVYFWLRG
jgi:hypothetical protein